MSENQMVDSNNNALEDVESDSSGGGKEKADIGDGDHDDGEGTTMGAPGSRHSSKRTVDATDLDEGVEGTSRSMKARYTGEFPGPSLLQAASHDS